MVFVIILIVIIALCLACLRVVPQATEYIIERLGKYKKTWTAGLHFLIPIIDKISNRVSLKEQYLDSPPQPVITKDNVTMQIDTVVFYKVFDANLFTYGAANPVRALENLTATTLRNIVGEMELDDTLTSRDTINGKMTEILDSATDQWGIKVNRVELKNIMPPAEIQNAMEKQMKAERDRRETLLEAEGHKAAVITRAQGDKQALVLQAEGERDARIARAEGEAKAIILAKKAEAESLKALKEAGADASVIELKKFEALIAMSNGIASKIIIPTDAVNMATSNVLFSETSGLGDVTKSSKKAPAKAKKDECCD